MGGTCKDSYKPKVGEVITECGDVFPANCVVIKVDGFDYPLGDYIEGLNNRIKSLEEDVDNIKRILDL